MLNHYLKSNKKYIIALIIVTILGTVLSNMLDFLNNMLRNDNPQIHNLSEHTMQMYQIIAGILQLIIPILIGSIVLLGLVLAYIPFFRRRRKVFFNLYGQQNLIYFQIFITFAIIIIVSTLLTFVVSMPIFTTLQIMIVIFCFTQAIYIATNLMIHSSIKYMTKGKKFKALIPWIGFCLLLMVLAIIEFFLLNAIGSSFSYFYYDLINVNLNELFLNFDYGMVRIYVLVEMAIYGILSYGIVIITKNKIGI